MTAVATGLGAHDQVRVAEAVAAVEIASEPVAPDAFSALDDPGLRAAVQEALASLGRCLLRVDGGFLSGYDDTIADRLAAEGIGVLEPVDAAVLTLVMLRSVAVPRARGQRGGEGFADGVPLSIDELALNRHLGKRQIKSSVRRLRLAGLLRPGHRADLVPGHQLLRLTQARSQRLWEDLVLVSQPRGMLAEVIRRRRHASTERATS
jgi:hypothetical protein